MHSKFGLQTNIVSENYMQKYNNLKTKRYKIEKILFNKYLSTLNNGKHHRDIYSKMSFFQLFKITSVY